VVKKYIPVTFKEQYLNTQLIIDATEFGIEHPLSLACTSSSYNNVKVLIGIIPSGPIAFVPPIYFRQKVK